MRNVTIPKRKCEVRADGECRALYCPRHRKRLAYCPWSNNGYVNFGPDPDVVEQEKREKRSKRSRGFPGWSRGPA